MPAKNKKGKVYPRVSSSVQEDGTSLDTQRAECIKLASSLGYPIEPEDVLPEVGSGADLDRGQLTKLRHMAAAGEFDALFVYSTDRLSRDPVELLVLLREFAARGVEVYFVQEPSDSTPEGELVKFVRGYAWSQERSMFRERSIRGKNAVARSGRVPTGARNQPYGYDLDPETRERLVNEAEARVLKRIFQQYNEGWSMYRIAKTLNEEGVPSKTGTSWSVVTIRGVLTNTSCVGIDYYGKTRSVGGDRGKGRQVAAPKEEWIEIRGYTPPLISEALFRQVNERLEEAQERYAGRGVRRYLLTGYVRCGWCGGSVVGAGSVGKYWYYRCSARARGAVRGENGCEGAYCISGEWLHDQVWSYVVAMVQDPSGVIADLESSYRTGGGAIGEEIERLQGEVRRLEQEEVRLLGLYQRGTIRVELLETETQKLSGTLEIARGRLSALAEQQEREEIIMAAGDRIRDYCLKVSAGLDELDDDGKRALLSRLGVKVLAVKRDVMITADIDPGFLINEGTCLPPCRRSPGLPVRIPARASVSPAPWWSPSRSSGPHRKVGPGRGRSTACRCGPGSTSPTAGRAPPSGRG